MLHMTFNGKALIVCSSLLSDPDDSGKIIGSVVRGNQKGYWMLGSARQKGHMTDRHKQDVVPNKHF
jgi:hypothetical protein